MVKDLVCGMDVSETETKHHIEYDGQTYYFCSEHCKEDFFSKPGTYLNPKKKGIIAKFLERLAKENKQTFGNDKPSCH